jgi:predicted nucleotidyltransferase
VISRESLLSRVEDIKKKAKESNLVFLALTGSLNKKSNTESSDIDFVFDYAREGFKLSNLYDLEDQLANMFNTPVHLISLRAQKPEVLLDMSKNFEVIFYEER